MSIISQAKRPAGFQPLASRLQLAVSAFALIALSACVAVDAPSTKHSLPHGESAVMKPAPEVKQRPPAEVRMSPQQITEPTIQRGTGKFVDTTAQLSRTGRGNYVVKLAQGDLGPSIKYPGWSVREVIGSRIGVSATLGFVSLLIAVLIGVPVGVLAASRPNRVMKPRVGRSARRIRRNRVVLPAPEGPVRNWKDCGAMSKLRSCRISAPIP